MAVLEMCYIVAEVGSVNRSVCYICTNWKFILEYPLPNRKNINLLWDSNMELLVIFVLIRSSICTGNKIIVLKTIISLYTLYIFLLYILSVCSIVQISCDIYTHANLSFQDWS